MKIISFLNLKLSMKTSMQVLKTAQVGKYVCKNGVVCYLKVLTQYNLHSIDYKMISIFLAKRKCSIFYVKMYSK